MTYQPSHIFPNPYEVAWVYFDNVPRVNSATSNVTQSQVDSIGLAGSTYYGKDDDVARIYVSGSNATYDPYNYNPNTSLFTYTPYYHQSAHYPASVMTYTRPDGTKVTGTHITGFMEATFDITVQNSKGGPTEVVQKTGVIIQMSNGDVFMRQPLSERYGWTDVKKIVDFTIVDVKPINNMVAGVNIDVALGDADYPPPCFARGTMIATDRGEVAVEDLRAGDLVMTRDNGLQPLRWIASAAVSAEKLDLMPALRPIRIRAGALGGGAPVRDLLVSPQHRILVSSRISARMFGEAEVLIAAKHLLGIDGIEVARDVSEVTYFHLLLDRHEVLTSDGAQTESLYLGSEARKAIGAEAWREIAVLFPELAEGADVPPGARSFVPGRRARRLATRQKQSAQPLYA